MTDTMTPAARHAQEIANRPARAAAKSAAPAAAALAATSVGTTATGQPASGTAAVQAVLETIGIDPTTAAAQASALLTAIDQSGLDPTSATDSSAVQTFTDTWLPQQQFFQQRFPGIVQQLAAGQNPTSVTDYLDLEDTLKGIAGQYGFDPSVFSPDVVANLITSNKSATEIANNFSTAFDEVENGPVQTRQAFAQFYGPQGDAALALHLLQVPIDTFKQQLSAAEIQGAGMQLGLNPGQATSEKLAALGVSYNAALAAAQQTVKEQGLTTQTMGEQSQATGPGATPALTSEDLFESNAKAASTGSSNSDESVQQEVENRENLFKGGGGASSTEAEGYLGLGSAKSS